MTQDAAVQRSIVVSGTPEQAFAVFTQQFDAIKPREHNLLGAPIVATILEPHVGGRILDRAEDGTECAWARVLAFDPPDRLVFSWDIGPTGSWRRIPGTPARSRSGSSRRARTAPASSSSTGISTGTVPAGSRCATASPTSRAGRCTWSGSPRWWPRREARPAALGRPTQPARGTGTTGSRSRSGSRT